MSKRVQSGELVVRFLAREGWTGSRSARSISWCRRTWGRSSSTPSGRRRRLLKWLAGAWVIVLIPVFAVFFLKDAERLTAAAISSFSHRGHRGTWWRIAEDVHRLSVNTCGRSLLMSLITFAVWAVGFLVAGVPYALVLAGIGGALEFIPVIGPLTAGVVAVGVSLFAGYPHPWLLASFIVIWRGIVD